MISRGKYPWTVKPGVVPGSDGAGVVLSVGKNVTRFQPGDRVITMLNQKHITGSLNAEIAQYGTGASVDGVFRSAGAFDEQALVAMPDGLSFVQAATLSCAGLTAWNALFGLPGKQVTAGQWVLVQGTGSATTLHRPMLSYSDTHWHRRRQPFCAPVREIHWCQDHRNHQLSR